MRLSSLINLRTEPRALLSRTAALHWRRVRTEERVYAQGVPRSVYRVYIPGWCIAQYLGGVYTRVVYSPGVPLRVYGPGVPLRVYGPGCTVGGVWPGGVP